VELSGIIFAALAVAWAAYLIPKALHHHDDVAQTRPVSSFSPSMRVLAHREPVNVRDARLVLNRPGAGDPEAAVPAARTVSASRASTRRATQRRRRVLGVLLGVNVVLVALAVLTVIGWVWQLVPAGLVVAWLIACRLMVKKERALPASDIEPVAMDESAATIEVERNEQGFDELDPTNETQQVPVVPAGDAEPGNTGDAELWDPLPMTLPTYVTKPAAERRSVRTIALDDSDVWTSGHTDADSAMVREAEGADHAARDVGKDGGERAVGS
jgi:hypothetical protein